MDIINYILWYLIIGCVVDFLYNQVENWLEDRDLLAGPRLSNNDRVINILLWPIGLCYFMYGFIIAYFFKDD